MEDHCEIIVVGSAHILIIGCIRIAVVHPDIVGIRVRIYIRYICPYMAVSRGVPLLDMIL